MNIVKTRAHQQLLLCKTLLLSRIEYYLHVHTNKGTYCLHVHILYKVISNGYYKFILQELTSCIHVLVTIVTSVTNIISGANMHHVLHYKCYKFIMYM